MTSICLICFPCWLCYWTYIVVFVFFFRGLKQMEDDVHQKVPARDSLLTWAGRHSDTLAARLSNHIDVVQTESAVWAPFFFLFDKPTFFSEKKGKWSSQPNASKAR